MKKLSTKIIVSILMIILAWVIIRFLIPQDETMDSGDITIQIYNEDSELVYEGSHAFQKDMYLYDVLDASFDLTCGNQSYQADSTCSYTFTSFAYQGKIILGISNDDFSIISNWTDTFLAIEYFDANTFVLSQKGPSHIALKDGDIIRISVRSVSS